MGWNSIIFPRRARLAYKRGRRLSAAIQRGGSALLLAAGWPRPLADHLRRHGLEGVVVLRKQGILSLVAGGRFLRYATHPRSVVKLQREVAGWRQLREQGLEAILPRFLDLHALGPGVLLEAELLDPIGLDDQMAVSLPIIQALVSAARPAMTGRLPASIEAGLQVARMAAGGSLPESFASEQQIRGCFARPVLTGISHQDLHVRNVMRDRDGRPVLIDLKSCASGQVLALDLLNFACKYRVVREGSNVVDQALAAQQIGWRLPGLDPVLALVDLPCPLWGPLFALHAIGGVQLKRDTRRSPNPILLKQVARLLSRDWWPAEAGEDQARSRSSMRRGENLAAGKAVK